MGGDWGDPFTTPKVGLSPSCPSTVFPQKILIMKFSGSFLPFCPKYPPKLNPNEKPWKVFMYFEKEQFIMLVLFHGYFSNDLSLQTSHPEPLEAVYYCQKMKCGQTLCSKFYKSRTCEKDQYAKPC